MLVDITQNYGAAFYSCAVGMGLGAICLALVGPAKSGMCPGGKRKRQEEERGEKEEEEEKMSQESDPTDFLEVDLVLESSPVKQAPSPEKAGGVF